MEHYSYDLTRKNTIVREFFLLTDNYAKWAQSCVLLTLHWNLMVHKERCLVQKNHRERTSSHFLINIYRKL